jgi:hypothetical protein
MIPVGDILSRTDDLLNDEDRVRWPVEERIRWMNDALGAILVRKPGALGKREVVALVAGTYQTIPESGSILLDVVRNIAANGTTPGYPIRRTDRQLLDDTDPTWHTGTQKAKVLHYTFDDRVPKVFYVYPPALVGTKVEMLYAALPDAVDDAADYMDIGPEYTEAVVNYVCYRANSKDSEFSQGAIAAAYYQAFEASLGMKSQADTAASPNQPGNSV